MSVNTQSEWPVSFLANPRSIERPESAVLIKSSHGPESSLRSSVNLTRTAPATFEQVNFGPRRSNTRWPRDLGPRLAIAALATGVQAVSSLTLPPSLDR